MVLFKIYPRFLQIIAKSFYLAIEDFLKSRRINDKICFTNNVIMVFLVGFSQKLNIRCL